MKWHLLPTLTFSIAVLGLVPKPTNAQSVSRVVPTAEFQSLQPTRSPSSPAQTSSSSSSATPASRPSQIPQVQASQAQPVVHQLATSPSLVSSPEIATPLLQHSPVLVSESTPVVSEPQQIPQQATRTVAASATIMVSFPARHLGMMDNGKHQMTVPLMQPLRDQYGEIVVPEFSPVQVELSPHRDSIRLTATAIDVGGRMISIKTSTVELGAIRVVQTSQYQQATDNRLPLTDIGSGIGALAGSGEPKGIIVGSLVGTALNWLFNDNSADHIYEVVIPEGETHMLELLEPITVPMDSL